MKWPAPHARSLADQVASLRRQIRDAFFGLDSLHATITRLEDRVRFLEEHAQLAQFKREDTK